MLPRRELLQGSRQAAALEPLIDLAERVLRTWEPGWSGFLAPDLREEAETRLASLSELRLRSAGGHPAAERRRLWLERRETAQEQPSHTAAADWEGAGLLGLEIAGNFLFDPATAEEFRAALVAAGIDEGEVGDLWLRGDRGAQAVVTAAAATALAERQAEANKPNRLITIIGSGEQTLPPDRVQLRIITKSVKSNVEEAKSSVERRYHYIYQTLRKYKISVNSHFKSL